MISEEPPLQGVRASNLPGDLQRRLMLSNMCVFPENQRHNFPVKSLKQEPSTRRLQIVPEEQPMTALVFTQISQNFQMIFMFYYETFHL